MPTSKGPRVSESSCDLNQMDQMRDGLGWIAGGAPSQQVFGVR